MLRTISQDVEDGYRVLVLSIILVFSYLQEASAMFHLLKTYLVIFIAAMTMQLCPSDAQATTVTELLDAMRQRQLSIQDYDFVVMRNVFHQAIDDHGIDAIHQKQQEMFARMEETPTEEQREQFASANELMRLSYEKSRASGALFQIKGISSSAVSYAVYGMDDPQRRQIFEVFSASPQDRNNPDLYKIPKPRMDYKQQRVVLPNLVVNGFPAETLADTETDLFVFPPHSEVRIEDNLLDTYRHHFYPFWHEEALHFATVDNTTIVSENEDEVELLISLPQTPPINFTFLLYCNRDGRAHRVIKKGNDEVWYVQDYLHFVELNPEGIEIPLVGRMWEPAMGLDSAHPSQETTRICTIVHSAINIGLTLDDLAIEAPAGTTVIDRRGNRTFVVDSLDSTDTITTTRPVRLGANLPNDINDLNREDE